MPRKRRRGNRNRGKGEKNDKYKIKKEVVKKPVKPSYAKILSEVTIPEDEEDSKLKKEERSREEIENYFLPCLPVHPKNKIHSYNSWEFSYFKDLENLKKIFIEGMIRLDKHVDEDLLLTPDFQLNFNRFIYDCSKGDIPFFGEGENEGENDYVVKRDNVQQ